MLQRKASKPGAGLGKSTGWVHRASLRHRGVKIIAGCEYLAIGNAGLNVRIDGESCWLDFDNIIVCAGQESVSDLVEPLRAAGVSAHVIGGAQEAAELDAKRAIAQGTRLDAKL